jgi:hypothetical protein
VSAPTPLLDFFKRGEVARDVKLLAAAGALAPRAIEQLSILVLLLDDGDPEIRTMAQQTIDRIPVQALAGVLARTDVPIGVREFFADRGVFPDEMPSVLLDDPLIESDPAADEEGARGVAGDEDGAPRESIVQQLQKMGFTERLKAAVKGTREMRAILVRDPNKMIAASVLSSSKVTEQEIETYARMANVSEDVLRIIGGNRAWTKNYGVVVALTRNPKTPLGMSLNLMARLNDRDLNTLSLDRNVPEPLRAAARRKVVFGQSR